MGFLAERNSLLYHVQATENQSTPERNKRPKRLKGLCDLGCKFSCRREDQGEQGLGLVEKSLEDWQGKSGRFTATCLCDTDDIAVLQGKGNRLLLNGSWSLVS
jgi:hypothetical protein